MLAMTPCGSVWTGLEIMIGKKAGTSAEARTRQASPFPSTLRGQIVRRAPLEVIAATHGAGVAATNRAILGIDRHSNSAIARPVAFFIRMTMTRAEFSLIELISCVR